MASTIRIGHASTDSASSVAKEVLIQNFYSSFTPTVLLRPKNATLASKSASACEAGCNNDKIEYSQLKRNSLREEAEKANINYDLSKITSTCYTDCSAFMTVCAVAGGASFEYGFDGSANAPTTRNMRNWFTKNGDYIALTADIYLKGTDYLQRGDILVHEGSHALMILDNGSKAPVGSTFAFAPDAIKINLSVKNISDTSIEASAQIYKLEGAEEEALADSTTINSFKWSYSIAPLNTSTEAENVTLKEITSDSSAFTKSNLFPNTTYQLKVIAKAKDSDIEFCSSSKLFTTKQNYPTAVKNLIVTFEKLNPISDRFKISFIRPDTWGSSSDYTGYRVHLLVNGESIGSNDSLITTKAAEIEQYLSITDIVPDIKLKNDDIVQIGVQPWVYYQNKIIFDKATLSCSEPIRVFYFTNMIDKIFIKIDNRYDRAILYKNN